MITKFDLGFFLNTIYPKRLNNYSKVTFLNDLLGELIIGRDIKDKNKREFYVGRELTSRLFSNETDIPQAIKKEIDQECKGNCNYIYIAYEAFKKSAGETNIYNYSKAIMETLENDTSFDEQTKSNIKEYFISQEYDVFLWEAFCLACLSPNRRGNAPIKSQGRPSKKKTKDSFFYLSEKEKKERAEYFIGFLTNENNRLKIEHLKELLEILTYYPISIAEDKKKKITYNFLKNRKSEKGISDANLFYEYFEDCKLSFPSKTKNFEGWKDAIFESAALIEIETLEKLMTQAKNTNDYSIVSKEFYEKIDVYSFYSTNNFFLKMFKRKTFHLPNFKEHINQSLWTYCHNVAIFCGKTILADDFIRYINGLKILNPNNNTIKDRCDGLIEKCLVYKDKNQ